MRKLNEHTTKPASKTKDATSTPRRTKIPASRVSAIIRKIARQKNMGVFADEHS